MSDALLSVAVWGLILFFIVRTVLKRAKGNRATSTANAEATAEGGEANAGSNSGVAIQFHIHIGDGISVSNPDSPDDSFTINPAELLRSRTIDSGGIRSLSDGAESGINASGSAASVDNSSLSARRRSRNQHLEIAE